MKVDYDAVPYPQYAYGTFHAALQAKALGLDRMSVIEFGVAGGNGLVALERIAKEVEEELGLSISVYGFDLAEGMPEAIDYRDLPDIWEKGAFKMDVDRLEARMEKAELILGDVNDTVRNFMSQKSPPPIGFISFDLDTYSST
jgi:hypothetical protein